MINILSILAITLSLQAGVTTNSSTDTIAPAAALPLDTIRFSTNVPDDVLVKRLKDINCFFPVPYNEVVKNQMIKYSEKMPIQMGRVLSAAEYYFPIFEEAFIRHGIPQELKYLSVVESMLKPTAVSRVGAAGLWQFMYYSAKGCGLKIDSFVDERLDAHKSAEAAARYLKRAYANYGDWNLAICSYNCGPGNVNKAILRSGSRNFWELYPFLPRETRGYVPAFVGAMYAMNYAREYGLAPTDSLRIPASDTIMVTRRLHFKQVNEVIGVSMDDLHLLNAHYVHDIIPGTAENPCPLRVPENWIPLLIQTNPDSLYTHRFKELLGEEVIKAELAKATATSRTAYKVKSGDCLGSIAARYGVKVSQIQKWNGLKSTNIRIGQTLYIYRLR